MYLPSLQPISREQSYVHGNVTVDPSVVIAPGVLLQADVDSQIVIAAGACIGMGVVLHAQGGDLHIDNGVNIGAGVLVVGQGRVGANVCIGASATIINPSLAEGTLVPPASLWGDDSRQTATVTHSEVQVMPAVNPPSGMAVEIVETSATKTTRVNNATPSEEGSAELTRQSNPVYGQEQLNQLMLKLFPSSRRGNPPLPGSQVSSDDS